MDSPTDRLSVALADRYRIERELGAGGRSTAQRRGLAPRPVWWGSSDEHGAHRMERAVKRIEYETEDLQCHDAEQRLRIARPSEDDGGVGLALGEREVALGYGSSDRGAVGQGKVHLAFGNEPDGLPHVHWQQRVDGPAVNQEADGFPAGEITQ